MDKFDALVKYVTSSRDWCSDRLDTLGLPEDHFLITHLKTQHRIYCKVLAYAEELRNQ